MKFYYRYVNGLKEPEVVTNDIDPAMLGSILHDIMKILYEESVGRVLTKEKLDMLAGNQQFLDDKISGIIRDKFSKPSDSSFGGNESIVRDVLKAYVRKILLEDQSLAPLTILNLEETFSFNINIESGDAGFEVLTGGKVDRIDLTEGVVRIVDYKTGSVADTINSVDDLFVSDRKKETDGWLQTLLYCEAYLTGKPGTTLRPSVYKIKKLKASSNTDKLKIKGSDRSETIIDDYTVVREDFIKNLKMTVADIFSTDLPFSMTTDIRGKCSYWPI